LVLGGGAAARRAASRPQLPAAVLGRRRDLDHGGSLGCLLLRRLRDSGRALRQLLGGLRALPSPTSRLPAWLLLLSSGLSRVPCLSRLRQRNLGRAVLRACHDDDAPVDALGQELAELREAELGLVEVRILLEDLPLDVGVPHGASAGGEQSLERGLQDGVRLVHRRAGRAGWGRLFGACFGRARGRRFPGRLLLPRDDFGRRIGAALVVVPVASATAPAARLPIPATTPRILVSTARRPSAAALRGLDL